MIGEGELILSEENIVEAVQQWLDKQWTVDSPVVKRVKMTWVGNKCRAEIELQSNRSFVGVVEPVP